MEEIALIHNWKPDDFERFEVKDLIRLVKGYRADRKELWNMTRYQIAYGMMPHYKNVRFDKIKLPCDDIDDKPKKEGVVGKVIKLNREELVETYRRNGFELRDDVVDKMFSK